MSEHIRPERWADLLGGRVGDGERADILAHAELCGDCAKAGEQVEAMHGTFSAIRDLPDVELSWEQLQAQIGWVAASEIRRRPLTSSWLGRWQGWTMGGAVAVAGLALLAWVGLHDADVASPEPAETAVKTVIDKVADTGVVTDPVALDGVVTLLQGVVHVDGQPASLNTQVRAGQTIVTGSGRLAVQIGNLTGFAVAANSKVVVEKLDDTEVALRVRGGVTLEVFHRSSAQRFAVWAGSRRVEVRGTKFSVVNRDDELDVTVSRGRVAVIENGSAVEVPAGVRATLGKGQSVLGAVLQPLGHSQRIQLEESMRVPMVRAWSGAEQTRSQSARLRVDGKARVRVDGIEMGVGAMELRTEPGRHLVEVGARSQWLEVAPGAVAEPLAVQARIRSKRPRQFDEQLRAHQRAFAVCGNRMRKFDPAFQGVIQVEVGINGDGSIGFVDARKGLPDRGIEECVLDIVRDSFVLPAGDKATVRKTIRF